MLGGALENPYLLLSLPTVAVASHIAIVLIFLHPSISDQQEVFVHKESDISVIVELLCNEPDQSAVEALDYHFSDLAECNEAESKEVLKKQVSPSPRSICLGVFFFILVTSYVMKSAELDSSGVL